MKVIFNMIVRYYYLLDLIINNRNFVFGYFYIYKKIKKNFLLTFIFIPIVEIYC